LLQPAGDLLEQPARRKLERHRSTRLLAGTFVGMPRRVAAATPAALHLTADGRHRTPQVLGDRGEGIATIDPQQDLLALVDRQTALTWLPPERPGVKVPAGAGHDADHRRAAADLLRDVDQPPALRVQPERELLLLPAEMTVPALHPDLL